MAVYGGTNLSSVQVQIQNAFARSLVNRIQDVEDIIRITSAKELKNALPMIVEGIFGFGPEIGWDVDRISNRHYAEFDSLRHFLSPEGPLLKLIYNLQAEPYTYEFSIQYLPSPTRHMIEDGIIPSMYANKVQQQPHGLILALSAFEFYMFHFAYALVNSKFQKCVWHEFYDYVYPNLMDDYLSYFLPLDKKRLPTLPHTASPIRSPVSHYPMSPSQSSPSPSPSVSPRKSSHGLFKTSFTIANQKQHVPTSPILDQCESETWHSETMLQIWCEFWLNQNSASSDSNRSGITPGTVEHLVPTANHVYVVRVLVKYLHYFVNTASPIVTSPYHTPNLSTLDEFKKILVPQILQKKLYIFLRHAFDHWPLDSSFKMVLEIWLSYIQPWRYTDPTFRSIRNKARPDLDNDKRLEDKWYQFIEDNLLFYSVLFQEFLPRIYRLDLTSFSSTYMSYRATKVLSKSNLCILIERAERKLCSSSFTSARGSHTGISDLRSSYLYIPEGMSSLPPQFLELESVGFQYIPLFGNATQNLAHAVLDQMMEAKFSTAKQPANVQKRKKQGFFAWLGRLFAENTPFGEVSPEEIKKQQTYLVAAIRNVCTVFKLSVPAEISDSMLPVDNTLNDSNLTESTLPDFMETENGPQLTSLGRYQVANGLKKFDVVYYGDPDLEPIKSFENAMLVRYFHNFCESINSKFYEEITVLNNRTDFVGRMIQTYISQPLRQYDKVMSPISKIKADHLRQPRISLRFLASYQNLIYLGILYLVLSLWFGLGPVGFIVFMLCGCVVFAAFTALAKPKRSSAL